jgi:hypothetical protein
VASTAKTASRPVTVSDGDCKNSHMVESSSRRWFTGVLGKSYSTRGIKGVLEICGGV